MRSTIADRRASLPQPQSRDLFRRIYKHTFPLGRQPGQKSLPLESAIEFWRLLFSSPSVQWNTPSTPWLDYFLEFMEARYGKSINADIWNETLKFWEQTVRDESLSWWSEETSAWPSVIDEFVLFVRDEKRGGGKGDQDMVDE